MTFSGIPYDLERSECGLIEVLSQYMNAETEKSHKNLNQDSNQAPAEYKCTMLSLSQPARLQLPTVVVSVPQTNYATACLLSVCLRGNMSLKGSDDGV
jgi:hypothetical protein